MSVTEKTKQDQALLGRRDRIKQLKARALSVEETVIKTGSPFFASLLSQVYYELVKLGVDLRSLPLVQAP